MSIKTINFLPEIFRSDINKKFLNATLDQLVSQPDFNKENGYVGRKFAPTFKSTDNYIQEVTNDRQNYQLEPSVVSTDDMGNVQFFQSYMDLINQIEYYNGIVTNHTRMFGQEAYTYDGKFNFDKFVNFSQYYWLPTGPDPVVVFPDLISTAINFEVTRNDNVQSYNFDVYGKAKNPDIILARGGSYQFNVNQPGNKFWIQTEPGLDGTYLGQQNVNTRDVLGVSNNGADDGVITFNVPLVIAQENYVNMPLVQAIDVVSTSTYDQLNGASYANLVAQYGGIDGIVNLTGKYVVFANNLTNEPAGKYHTIWQIQIAGDIINLVYIQDIPVNNKVFVKSGLEYANTELYKKPTTYYLALIPLITAPLSTLYYNDSTNQSFAGRIILVDAGSYILDIEDMILGKQEYTSPNGVTLTNGLKIKFGAMVTPTTYVNNEYYVEGVGDIIDGIELIRVDYLVTPELNNIQGASTPFDVYGFDTDKFDQSLNGPQTPDYITINRASIDGNPWSRSNRWFHTDIIQLTATYNNTIPLYNQLQRAQRPIIEFDEDLLLMNSGRIAHPAIDYLDFTITNALTQVEGNVVTDTTSINYQFKEGMNVIFAADFDPIVNNKVFEITFITIDNVTTIHLVEATNGDINQYDAVAPTSGITVELLPISDPLYTFDPLYRQLDNTPTTTNPNGLTNSDLTGIVGENAGLITGKSFWYNGSTWVLGQQKVGINAAPLFDIVDSNLNSLSDRNIYNSSSFVGSKLFSYLEGIGINDSVLGFPLSYQNFNNQGDIQFENNFDVDTFTQLTGLTTITEKINQGFIARIVDAQTITKENNWVTKSEDSKQYQLLTYLYDGSTSSYKIDVSPGPSTTVPNLKVFVNFSPLASGDWFISSEGIFNYLTITSNLSINDQVEIKIYNSINRSDIGYYEIPSNLEFNALNEDFTVLTLGQLRNHVIAIAQNNNQVIGSVPGDSNLRDINISASGGTILQHSAPAIYSSLFLLSKDLNFIDSISYAQREYSKFKNRFFEMFNSVLSIGITDASAGVDYILGQINAIKNKLSPWYYSDMVPYGGNYTMIAYTVISTEQTEYEINAIFNDKLLSNTAVLVYINGVQLVKDTDYTFNQTRPTVMFNGITFNFGDKIAFKIYSNTDGNFIPETPTKLGLYPKYKPQMFSTNVGVGLESTVVIQGHDGSLTQAFGDFRDNLLIELELRIYNNIKAQYNTVNFDIYNFIPGKFRDTEYSITEFNQILSRCFLTWLGSNRIDYSTNEWFSNGNPWSWTYNKFKDLVDGEYLLGYWRGIYKYFYDTDAPNERPWEMLGFGEQPSWWESYYGPAPYTGGNMVLWNDLEEGIIRSGDRAGTYVQYARPGLSSVIPVDDSGALRAPNAFLVTGYNGADVANSFVIGDQGPVETAWRRSSDYPYAVQQALALMKPALYFGQLSNVQIYNKTSGIDQFVISDTKQRITPSNFVINGATVNGSITRNAGYLNWIADYITGYGAVSQTQIQKYLSTLNVQLGYKVAGFTDKPYLTMLAEQSSPSSTNNAVTIPNENYQVYVHKSSPIARLIYSAVIVEKTGSGYSVSGYSTEQPYFKIIPSMVNNNFYTISASGIAGIIYNNYQPQIITIPYGYEFINKQQVVDFLVSYSRFLTNQGFTFNGFDQDLQQTKDWILSAKEFLTWTQQGWSAGNIIVLSPVSNSISLTSTNAVVDEIDNSPMGSKVLDVGFNVVKSNIFTVIRDDALFTLTADPQISIGLLDVSLVQYEDVLVFDNVTSFSDVIYQPSTGNRQFRLKYVGYKTNGWTGQLNPPGFIYSSPNVNNWSPGEDYLIGDIVMYNKFMYSALQDIDASDTFNYSYWTQLDLTTFKTGLLPNLSYNAEKFENLYDVDNQVEDQGLNTYSMGLIGYCDRAYLDDLRLDSTSQVKFYQGFIKDKGTANAINAMSTATFDNLSGNMQFYEEWAFRVGEYGATESNQFVEISLADSEYIYNPVATQLLLAGKLSVDPTVIGEYETTLYKKPLTYRTNIFQDRTADSIYENDIKTAGYVNLKDINASIFDIQNYQNYNNLVSEIFSGYKIWVAKDNKRDWNVYRVTETALNATNILYSLDTYATVTTDKPHGLSIGDIFAIRNFSSDVDGFYIVEKIPGQTKLFVSITSALETTMQTTPSLDGIGSMFLLHSVRTINQSDIAGFTPNNGWSTIDKLWVDIDQATSEWAVYQKNEPWNYTDELVVTATSRISGNNVISSSGISNGSSIAASSDGAIVVVGAPLTPNYDTYDNFISNGSVRVFVKTAQGPYAESTSLSFNDPDFEEFGTAVDVADRSIAVGAPKSYNSKGKVIIYGIQDSGKILPIQVISKPGNLQVAQFGSSVSFSNDASVLYVGAPVEDGKGKVYSFNIIDAPYYAQTINTFGNIVATSPYTLGFTPESTDSVLVSASSDLLLTNVLVPHEDYEVINGNQIKFLQEFNPGVYNIVQNSSYYDFGNANVISDIDSALGDTFGASIKAVGDGSTVVVGAPSRSNDSIVDAGSAYLYRKDGSILQLFNATDPTYNARFGTSITISDTGAEIFISAPGHNVSGYHGGQVYRFTNAAMTYNAVSGNTIQYPVSADILLNNVPMSLSIAAGSTADADLKTAIDNYAIAGNISGLTVYTTNSILSLTYMNTTDSNRLTVIGNSINHDSSIFDNDLANLGLPNAYVQTQIIRHPYSDQFEKLGTALAYNEVQKVLFIGSEGAPTIDHTTIDSGTTIFDGGAMLLFDQISNTGAVYVFEELGNSTDSINTPRQYGFIQEVVEPAIKTGDNFGSAIGISKTAVFVGANHASTLTDTDTGRIFYFSNPDSTEGWSLLRYQQPQVDIDSLTRIFLYNNMTEVILNNLDHLDPAKGKILGAAEQDIAYKTEFDPATYNTGSNSSVSISKNFSWGSQQVGRLWWDLDLVRYIDYEQDSLTYRINNWGTPFSGSIIEINEWVKSSVLPSQYAGDGASKYIDDSAYATEMMVDPATGNIVTNYYYWVTNRTLFDENLPFRRSSALAVADMITNPSAQNIPYAALIQNNALALFSSSNYISDSNTILHIDYALLNNDNIIHNEYELIQENSANAVLPNRIINKFIDSLTGADGAGNIVPDPTLSVSERYGISIRPRQTMFVNREVAAQNFVEYVNNIFKQNAIVELFDLSKLYLAELEPLTWDPVANQNIAVDTYTDLSYIDPNTLITGQRILVHADSNYNNQWDIYEYQANLTFKVVRIQNYQTIEYWSKVDWFDSTYDSSVNPTYTVASSNDIAALSLEAGDIIWVTNNGVPGFEVYRVNSDLTTSLVGIENGTIQLSDALWAHNTHEIGYDNDSYDTVKFDQNPTIEFRNIINALKDDIFINTLQGQFNNLFFMLLNYILSEQRMIDWAFKTSFISILHKLRKLDQYPVYIQDNQTYYQDYINEVKPYRTTIREYVIDYEGNDSADIHPTDFDLPAYYDSTLKMWRSPSGEQPNDANLIATQPQYADWYNNHTFSINSVKIEVPGYGYSSPPALVVEGGGGTGALLEAVVDGSSGAIVQVIVFDPGKNYTSTPTIKVLGDGIDEYGNQTAILYPTMTNSKIRTFTTSLKFDRISYSSNVKQWAENTDFSAGDTVSYNGTAFTVNADITTGSTFVLTDYTMLPDDQLRSAADRVEAFYFPSVGMPGKNLPQLFYGTEYPGNLIDGSGFLDDPLLPLDTNIQSQFNDLALGIRPEDINIVGGAFVDTYSSHAPEELLPGMIYDTLDIKVFTVNLGNPSVNPIGYRITQKMSNYFRTSFDDGLTTFDIFPNVHNLSGLETLFDNNPVMLNQDRWEFRRICADSTTTLVKPLSILDTTFDNGFTVFDQQFVHNALVSQTLFDDSPLIYVADVSTLPVPNPHSGIPGTIYINSEKITYWTVDPSTNSLGQIRRGVWGTASPPVQPVGSLVVDASIRQLIPGGTTPDVATATCSWLDVEGLPNQILVGNGLMFSSTEQALFIKECSTYLPWLPGGSGGTVDPNAFTTRFDDDGTGEIGTPVHPFDIDPFDSYFTG